MEEDHGSVTEERVDSPGMVGLVAYHDLPKAWPLVREYIVAALAAAAQHELTIEYIEDNLRKGEYVLMVMQAGDGTICGGCILTKSTRADGSTYMGAIAVGGQHLERWDEALAEAFKTVARAVGAAEIVMVGRPGWRRALSKFGVRERAVILSYEVA